MQGKEEVLEHWENNALFAEHGDFACINISSTACEFCLVYKQYEKCPVFEKTKQRNCLGTPYYEVKSLLHAWRRREYRGKAKTVVFHNKIKRAVDAMVIFLKSL